MCDKHVVLILVKFGNCV